MLKRKTLSASCRATPHAVMCDFVHLLIAHVYSLALA